MKGSGSALRMRRLELFPLTTVLEQDVGGGTLSIGGCRLSALAAEFGTPLYCFDAATLNDAAEQYRAALASAYPGSSAVTYAGKAYLSLGIVRWVQRQGLWLDCTGVGELAIAVRAGLARERILVHGVYKSDEDLTAAVQFAAVIVV
ncbi:MAG: diaminopimelate decarboxylase, partial [Caldilinea sp.]